MSNETSSDRKGGLWETIQRVLLEPTAVRLEEGPRLKASMLSAFLLLIIVAMATQAFDPYSPPVRRISVTIAGFVLLLCYGLRWTRLYWLMGPIAVVMVAIPPFVNTIRGLDPNDSLKWLAMTLLTGGLWLSGQAFAIHYALVVAGVISLPFFIPEIAHNHLSQVFSFLFLLGVLNISSIVFRTADRNRIERQTKALEAEIAERKAAEAELQENKRRLEELVEERTAEVSEKERLLQGIIDHSPAVIYVKDKDGRYQLVNPLFHALFNLDNERVIGKTDHDIFPKKEADQFRANDVRVLQAGRMIESEEIAIHQDGSAHWYISLKFPLQDTIRQRHLLCGISTDITARKHAEDALRNALKELHELKSRLEAENIYLQEEIQLDHNFKDIVTQSRALSDVLRRAEQAAGTDVTVLITGETGTGKELVARAIHGASRRKERPLVKVNCAALPESLVESELFGHEKGAFTGATERKIGRFELANGGTIFLDEIGDLPPGSQGKLLRVLQEGELQRVGSSETLTVDTRVIAATNHDIAKDVEKGKFRRDLYYRLNVFPVVCLPLRERKEDIPLLVNHFIRKHAARLGKEVDRVSQNVLNVFQAYDWPGNIRELESLIERLLITSRGAELQLGQWLPDGVAVIGNGAEKSGLERLLTPRPLQKALTDLKRYYITRTLEHSGGIQKRAAEILGINPSYLSRLVKELGIES
jgi:PAS domain S-box-containing protein